MNPNPLDANSESMKFKDAAIVSTILMLFTAATAFMPIHGYSVYLADPQRFCWDLFNFLWITWITFFMALSGLMKYTQSKSPSDKTGV
jgi:hypothetical protein